MSKIKKLTENVPEEGQSLDLLDGSFKATVLIVLKVLNETRNKELKKNSRTMAHQIKNTNKQIEMTNCKRNQTGLWEGKL